MTSSESQLYPGLLNPLFTASANRPEALSSLSLGDDAKTLQKPKGQAKECRCDITLRNLVETMNLYFKDVWILTTEHVKVDPTG
jgi:hypothetical protein